MTRITAAAAAHELGWETVCPARDDAFVEHGYAGDLLSDVMSNAQEPCIIITIQAHKNTVAVATLTGAAAIVVCNSRSVPDDMANSCREEGIGLYRTPENQFTVSGKLYTLLNRGAE